MEPGQWINQKSRKRLMSRISNDDIDGCWEWTGSKTNGYGQFSLNGLTWQTHRLIWTILNGPIPIGMIVGHDCDNRGCCNPKHLILSTQQDNIDDLFRKGRALKRSGSKAHLTKKQVIDIRKRYQGGETQVSLAKEYGISKMHTNGIIHGRTWKHLPLYPRR